jgi:hypothetical protein
MEPEREKTTFFNTSASSMHLQDLPVIRKIRKSSIKNRLFTNGKLKRYCHICALKTISLQK